MPSHKNRAIWPSHLHDGFVDQFQPDPENLPSEREWCERRRLMLAELRGEYARIFRRRRLGLLTYGETFNRRARRLRKAIDLWSSDLNNGEQFGQPRSLETLDTWRYPQRA